MTPSTIRKIKLGNVALYTLSISSFPLMQSLSLACVVQDRALRRTLIKTGLYCFALYPALYGATANFLFSVVKTSFLAFLETAMQMTASTASTTEALAGRKLLMPVEYSATAYSVIAASAEADDEWTYGVLHI